MYYYKLRDVNYLCSQCLSPLSSITCMTRCTRFNIMWWNLSVTCDRSVVFSGYSGFLHDITEILLKVGLNTINQTKPHFVESYVKKSLLGYRSILYLKLLLILYFLNQLNNYISIIIPHFRSLNSLLVKSIKPNVVISGCNQFNGCLFQLDFCNSFFIFLPRENFKLQLLLVL